MKRVNKKSQVDVAITIGAIIIPLGAIFGALIFAWAMLGPIADAGKLAALISHDVATLGDVAYSVPDDIIISYSPPSQCSFTENGLFLTCLNGFMNVTSFTYEANSKDTMINFGKVEEIEVNGVSAPFDRFIDAHYSVDASIAVNVDLSKTEDVVAATDINPFIISFPAFGNLRDFGVRDMSPINIPVDNSIKISKQRVGLYDTLNPRFAGEDPLRQIIDSAFVACSNFEDIESDDADEPDLLVPKVNLFIPNWYYISVSGSSTLCLSRSAFSPDFEDIETAGVHHYDVYCFDFSQDPKCVFDVSTVLNDKNSKDEFERIFDEDTKKRCAEMSIYAYCIEREQLTQECLKANFMFDISTKNSDGDPLC